VKESNPQPSTGWRRFSRPLAPASATFRIFGIPGRTRTGIHGLKGRGPHRLDDGNKIWCRQQDSNPRLDAGNVALCPLSHVCTYVIHASSRAAACPRGRRCATSELSKSEPRCSGRCAGAGDAKRLLQMPGTPPGIRTRSRAFLRRVRMPIPPAGHSGRSALRVVPNTLSRATKKPGALRRNPGLGGRRSRLRVTSSPRPGLHSCADHHARGRTRARPRLGSAPLGSSTTSSVLSSSFSFTILRRRALRRPQKQKTRSARAVRVSDGRRSAYSRSLPSSGRTRSSPLHGRCLPRIRRLPACTTARALGTCASHSNRVVASTITLFCCMSVQRGGEL
jgi:hypothetical protein